MADRHSMSEKKREVPPLPRPLKSPTVDAHCHLDVCGDVEWHIEQADSVGINRIVQVGCDVESSQFSVELANKYPGRIVAAVALHPNDAPRIDDLENALSLIESLAEDPRVRAIGETGLDYFRTKEDKRDIQEYSFRRYIRLAHRLNKTLMIHDRDAHLEILRILDDEKLPKNVIFHCFSGDAEFAKQCVDRGFVLSFSGTITFKNAPGLREALALVPDHMFTVETDAPFLTPEPHRGQLNSPAMIPHTIRLMADVRGVSSTEISELTSATAERLFGPF